MSFHGGLSRSALGFAVAGLLGVAGCCGMCDSSGAGGGARGDAVTPAVCAASASFTAAAPPAKPVSLTEGAKTLPDWIEGDTRVDVGGRPRGLPQVEGAAKVFAALGPLSVERLDGAVVACRVESIEAVGESRFLRVGVRVGDLPEVTHQGKEKESAILLTIPGVTVAKGESVTVRAAMVDASCRMGPFAWWLPLPLPTCAETTARSATQVERVSGAFPMSLAPKGFRVECRAMARDAVEVELASRLREADEVFPKLCDALRIHPDHRRWGWPPSSASGGARGAVDDAALLSAAGLVTWADPRVAGRVARYERIRSEWESALGERVKAEATKKPRGTEEVVRAGQVSVRLLDGIACDAAAAARYKAERAPAGHAACFVRVEVKNLGAGPLQIEHSAGKGEDGVWLGGLAWRQVDVVFSTGHMAGARFLGVVSGGQVKSDESRFSVPAGGTLEIVLAAAVREAEAHGSEPALVRLFHDDAQFTEAATLLSAR